MKVREILDQKMAQAVSCISVEEPVYIAAKRMAKENIGALAVLEGTRLVGVISERDILTKIVSRKVDPERTFVGEIMSTDLVIAAPDETFESCEEKMRNAHCRHVLIVQGQTLVGILSLRDVLNCSSLEKHQVVVADDKVWEMSGR